MYALPGQRQKVISRGALQSRRGDVLFPAVPVETRSSVALSQGPSRAHSPHSLWRAFRGDPLDSLSMIATVLDFRMAVQEMVLAVWLIAKRFNPTAQATMSGFDRTEGGRPPPTSDQGAAVYALPVFVEATASAPFLLMAFEITFQHPGIPLETRFAACCIAQSCVARHPVATRPVVRHEGVLHVHDEKVESIRPFILCEAVRSIVQRGALE